ncbi:MAG: hypothetical protein ABIV47_21585 [Roseiflexaceae bacterium]
MNREADPIVYTPARDLLGHTAPLDQRARFPLLGLPLEFRSNSAAVIAAAEATFGRWRDLAPELIAPNDPLIVDLIVHPAQANEIDALPQAHFIQRVHGDWFIASSGANLLTARRGHGQALGFVTPELVADTAHFRYNVLECLALLLASWRDRTPIHAGAVAHAGQAALLVGASGSGKSTLCYACARAGLSLLAEDVVYVGLREQLRLWGNPWCIHLLPDAPRFFPELAERPVQIQANGKRKLAVDLAELGATLLHYHAERAVICLVDRHDGSASTITPIEPQEAVAALSDNLEAGFDLGSSTRVVAEALAAGGAYQLGVGNDLAGAVELLRDMLGALSGQAVHKL